MKIIVTSGATREHIDPVRFISNVSTGRLGALIADNAVEQGHSVIYIHGVGAALPIKTEAVLPVEVVSTENVYTALEENLKDPAVKAVFHPMAVSDYTPAAVAEEKIGSGEPRLEIMLTPTPKVVDLIKSVRPDVFLAAFKLETSLLREDLIARARKVIARSGADLVVANLLEQTGERDHHALFITADEVIGETIGKAELARKLVEIAAQATHG